MQAPRPIAAALLAAVAAGTLAGCSPPDEPQLAVGRGPSGLPVLHLRACKGQVVWSVGLRGPEPPRSAAPLPSSGGSWPAGWVGSPTGGAHGSIWKIENRTDTARAWAIEYGTTPPGWAAVQLDGLPATPPKLSPTARYIAGAGLRVTDVEFTLADLEGLKDGEVRGHKGHETAERTLTLRQYRKEADNAC
ncbi:hypothetical protein [Dactylosporangium sp. NPDC005555]|uniref:hypothetical protein n=1 Tax=Dactylosporangium sp. NPDC005555 TaxID=3154889 RepID=UPI0033B516F1